MSELFFACMESSRAECEEHYFIAHPELDTRRNRQMFRAAYERGYSKAWQFKDNLEEKDA